MRVIVGTRQVWDGIRWHGLGKGWLPALRNGIADDIAIGRCIPEALPRFGLPRSTGEARPSHPFEN